MTREHSLTFGPYRLETTPARLWRGAQPIPLRPQTGAVLRYLVAHPGRLVTKAELLQHVWAGRHVTDTVLRVCIREIRVALADPAAAPQYLQTVGRQGYQWLGARAAAVLPGAARPLVGRQAEVAALAQWGARAATGARQLVFLSGEAGIGKTTVVDLWLAQHAPGPPVWLGRGQCAEPSGAGEAYLPVLEALGQLSRGPAGAALRAALRRCAPMWLGHLPGVVSEAELERVQRQVQGATPARMIRELAEALEVLTVATPLVLVLEDLHWSDPATVACLAYLAQRRAPARLLVLGTYRPVETVLQGHPLRGLVQELCGRGQAVEVRLECLGAAEVAAYVAQRLGGPVAPALAAWIAERTDGNALFMVNLVDHLVEQGGVVWEAAAWRLRAGRAAQEASLPEGVRQLLLRRIEALAPAPRQVLEGASVVGREFAVAAVAAGLQWPDAVVEGQCDALVRQHHVLTDAGSALWPDGTRGGRYRFQHALYQQVVYQQLGTARRQQLHGRIGVRLEAGYGGAAGEIAAPLAVHFERAGAGERAVPYLQQVAATATRRQAYPEAIAALRHGLTVLATLPASPARAQHALTLLLTLGELYMATQGMASPEADTAYRLAHTLCQGLEGTFQHFQVLRGLCRLHRSQAQLRTAAALSQHLSDVAQCLHDDVLVLESHMAIGNVAFYRGDLVTARVHLEQSLGLWDTPQLPTTSFSNGYELRVMHGFCYAMILWLLGYADQAQQWGQETLTLAQQLEHPPSLAYAQLFSALLTQFRRDAAATQAHINTLMTATTARDFVFRLGQGHLLQGWALAMQEDADAGITLIRQGFTMTEGMGLKLYRPYFLALLAEAYGQAGQPESGLTVLEEALTLVEATDERWWEAEVYRLKGELLLRLPHPDLPQATACVSQALNVARQQQARALELRTALSLTRLWQQQNQGDQARQLLTAVSRWFTEGFETPDLQEAQALLQDLEAEETV